MKIVIIGQGYVGLNLSLFASRKYKVIGFDKNEKLINQLTSGISHVEDVSSIEIQSVLKRGNYVPTSNINDIEDSDIYVIAVPTPLDKERVPDLTHLVDTSKLIAKVASKSALIINESTSFPGTLRNLIKKIIEENSNVQHLYAVSPERVDPGRKDYNQINTPRLLSALDDRALQVAKSFYSNFCENIHIVSSPEVAETAKLFENTFRQVNIALVNELAIICHSLEINVFDVINAASTKPYGFMKFLPGPGVGGHCIPVDPTYLAYRAEQVGVKARFIDLANQVNLDMSKYVVDRCEELLSSLKNKKILISGITYKPNIADVRESPAELIRKHVLDRGAEVSWFDPLVNEWFPGKVKSLEGAKYDLVIFQTIHDVMEIEKIRNTADYLFDCTGQLPGVPSI